MVSERKDSCAGPGERRGLGYQGKEATGAAESLGYAGIDIRKAGRDAKVPSYLFYVILVAV